MSRNWKNKTQANTPVRKSLNNELDEIVRET